MKDQVEGGLQIFLFEEKKAFQLERRFLGWKEVLFIENEEKKRLFDGKTRSRIWTRVARQGVGGEL